VKDLFSVGWGVDETGGVAKPDRMRTDNKKKKGKRKAILEGPPATSFFEENPQTHFFWGSVGRRADRGAVANEGEGTWASMNKKKT